MADNSLKAEVRKLRKKLRQIENLERLERDLTQQEYEKVCRKVELREILRELLKKREEEDKVASVSARMEEHLEVTPQEDELGLDLDRQVPPVDGVTANCSSGAGVNHDDIVVPATEGAQHSESDESQAAVVPHQPTINHSNNAPANINVTEGPSNTSRGARIANSSTESERNSARSRESINIGASTSSNASEDAQGSSNQRDAPANSTSSAMRTAPKQRQKQQGRAAVKPSSSSLWHKKEYTVTSLQGHNDIVCSVAMDASLLASGSRDTMLKIWDCDAGKELRSLGGHTGGITSVVLVKKDHSGESVSIEDGYLGVTGSHDCSIKLWSVAEGTTLRSIYAYSPILSLDHCHGRLVSGSESGKVELWDLESGENIRSARCDDESVTCIKVSEERVVSGSSLGVVKVWDVRQRSLLPAVSSDTLINPLVKKRRVHCLATTENDVYWGDDGTNIKVLDIRTGKVRKLKNHLTEFGSTSAMVIQDSLLISSGYDLDKGAGYLNVRSLPDEEYLATIDDDVTSYISCLCSTNLMKDGATSQRLCTGGNELKVWDQMNKNKMRKRPRDEEDSTLVTCKHLRRYNSEDMDTESSDDSDDDDHHRDESSDDDDDHEGTTSTARQSWCTIS